MIKHKIFITRRQRGKRLNLTLLIRRCVRATLDEEGVTLPCEIDVTITDDREIRDVNRESRDIDRATDVLSFPMFELTPGAFEADESMLDPETELLYLGDIMMSSDHIVAQAAEYGHSPEREAGYLTIHSTLHLLGYDHTDEGPQKAQMREREELILKKTGLNEDE